MTDVAAADPTIDAREALGAALLEWRELLRDAAMLHSEYEISEPQRQALESSSDPDAVFWLECNGLQTAEHVEAVELLALLARVDYSLWKQLVREVFDGGDGGSDWADLFDSRTSLRVGVHVIACDDDFDVPELSALIVDSLAGPRSARYKAVAELMERGLGRPVETLAPIPVWFDCAFTYDYRGEREDDVFFDIVEEAPKKSTKSGPTNSAARRDSDYQDYDYDSEGNLVEDGEDSDDDDDFDGPTDLDRLPRLVGKVYKALARQPATDQPSVMMRITQFTLRPSDTFSEREFLTADTRVLARLKALRGLGIRVTDLPTMCFDDRNKKSHKKTLKRVQSLLDATNDEVTTVSGVERCAIVHLGARLCVDVAKSLKLAPRVFSAVQASDSLRSVMTDFKNMARKKPRDLGKAAYGEAERKRLVWWMTYGLFARRRPLETIDISAGAMRVEDVESMVELWNASDPLALLFGDEAQFAASSIEPVTFKSPVQLEVRCVRSAEAFLALLRLVGHDVKYLTIRGSMLENLSSPASFHEQVLMACPHLEVLELSEPTGLKPLVEQLRSGQYPRLQGLTLLSALISRDEELLQLIDELSRPQHALAKQLRKLQLFTWAHLQQGTLDALVAMLRTNTRLRGVMLRFEVARELFDEYDALFKSLNLSRAVQPCPVPSALALVSTVRSSSIRWPLGALGRLDNDIVRRVLAFAATPHTRAVEVELMRAP